ncbi:hypothetical protein GUI49_06145 [Enterococcus mundtii]|uniref:MucBP domain-containing protein n=2 Tax=Enterococcus mundtii TaxID=53346 RepID=UPI0013712C7B|nr:MucBP domain-containing protein [Enterococcus mundtii]NAB10767.1 hypothetical protein [Enterococcus mundtii]
MDKKKQIRLASSILAIGLLTNASLQAPIAHAQDNLVASANTNMLLSKNPVGEKINIVNGDFESPVIKDSVSNIIPQEEFPGWKTTASDGQIELQSNGFEKMTTNSGRQWAELNANVSGALYQDIPTTPGAVIYWQISHRGRQGTDTAAVKFGAPGSNLETIETMKTGTEWQTYSGYYTIPEGQTTTRFQFEAVATSTGDKSIGNLIDNVVFTNEYTPTAEAEPVTVNYVDEQGNQLAPSETLNGKIGENYTTTPKEIENYVLKETPKNANGIFSNQAQTVTYVYEKAEGGTVTVNYVDEDGNKLADPETLTGKIGENYQTSAKDIPNYVLKETPSNANGIFSNQAQTVTYVYEKAEGGTVTVNYVDEDGNKLADPETLTGKIGENYQTSAKDIPNYVLKETPSNAQGTFSDQAQTVTYVYEKAEGGTVTVNYVDEDGNKLADPETLTGKIGENYQTSAKDIPNYVLKETPSNAQGTFSDQAQTVTYVYEKAEGEAVTVNYVDEDGKALADPETLTGKIGESYETAPKEIKDYVVKETPKNAQGTFSDQAQTVTYVYEKAEGEAVTVNYVDEEGNALADPDTLTGKIGESYETAPREIKDYVVKETPKNAQGTFSDQAQTVTYVYEKAEGEAVTVNYVDEEGNALADPDTLTGKIGESYETTPKEIKDYVVKETPKNAQGTFSDQAQTVTYVYEKAEGEAVTVNYVDEEGNALADPDTLTGKIGESYETTPKEIKDYVVKETPKNAQGTFSDQAQTVTYVYEKAEGEAVTVSYMDKDDHSFVGVISDNHKSMPKTYPKTGENQNISTLYSLSGITAVVLAAWVYLKRKLKNTKIDN